MPCPREFVGPGEFLVNVGAREIWRKVVFQPSLVPTGHSFEEPFDMRWVCHSGVDWSGLLADSQREFAATTSLKVRAGQPPSFHSSPCAGSPEPGWTTRYPHDLLHWSHFHPSILSPDSVTSRRNAATWLATDNASFPRCAGYRCPRGMSTRLVKRRPEIGRKVQRFEGDCTDGVGLSAFRPRPVKAVRREQFAN